MNSVPKTPGYQDVLPVVYKALDELNQQRPRNQRLLASPDCILFGDHGDLNSLEMANFMVLIEQMVQDTFGTEIDLTADDPFSAESGHMRTAGALAAHISEVVQQQS